LGSQTRLCILGLLAPRHSLGLKLFLLCDNNCCRNLLRRTNHAPLAHHFYVIGHVTLDVDVMLIFDIENECPILCMRIVY
jgi:hypothetical protein